MFKSENPVVKSKKTQLILIPLKTDFYLNLYVQTELDLTGVQKKLEINGSFRVLRKKFNLRQKKEECIFLLSSPFRPY